MSLFDPERLLKALARRRVRYVLVGAVAARLQGFPRMTADTDISPARDQQNLKRLAAALRDLKAKVYTESVPEGLAFDCSAETLGRAEVWKLITAAGRVDILFAPSGTTGFEGLEPSSVQFTVFGVDVRAASLEDILRSKEAADRPQDRADAVVLREMLRANRSRT